jgi:galactose mutarotase-like enzyme
LKLEYAHVDDRWKLCGLDTVLLESDRLRVVVVPGHGGHVQQITDKASGHDLLFENPRREPYPPVYGEQWSAWLGGIDELIPTGWASRHQGERYPDHGEVVARSWKCDILERGPEVASIRLFCHGLLAPFRVERVMTLAAGSNELRMEHTVTNMWDRPWDFLWGLHASFQGRFDYRMDLPADTVYEEHYRADKYFDGGPIPSYTWPYRDADGQRADMRRPQPGPDMILHYAMATDGWAAFTDLDRGVGVAIGFDPAVFPVIGLWILRGRGGHKLTSISPWTGWPVRVADAAEGGRVATLGPGEQLTTSTRWVVHHDRAPIVGMSPAGELATGEPASAP